MSWKPNKPVFSKFKKQTFIKMAKVADFIYQIGESEALRKPSFDVDKKLINSEEFKQKISYLKKCLIDYRTLTGMGRGITAVQVGISERFSAIYTPEKVFIIINPKVTRKSEKLLRYPEMCMSAAPIIVPTIRPSWIEFDYYDEGGKLRHWNMKDATKQGKMMNRILQHEIDHMDGIINIDRVKNPKNIILESDPEFYSTAKFEEVT